MADTTQQTTPITQQGQQNTQQNGQTGDQSNMQQQQLQQNMQPEEQPYKLSDHDLEISFDEPEKKDDGASDPLSFSDEDWTLDETFDPEDNVSDVLDIKKENVVDQEDISNQITTQDWSNEQTYQQSSQQVQSADSSDSLDQQVINIIPEYSQNQQEDVSLSQEDVSLSSSSSSFSTNMGGSSAIDSNDIGAEHESNPLEVPQIASQEQGDILISQIPQVPSMPLVPDDTQPREEKENEPEKKMLSTLEDMLEKISVLMSDIYTHNNNEDIRIIGHKTATEHVEYMFTHDTILTVTKIMHHDSTQHVLSFENNESLRVTLDNEEVYHSDKESFHEQVESYLKDKLTKFIMLLEGHLSDLQKKKKHEIAQQKQQNMVAGLRSF